MKPPPKSRHARTPRRERKRRAEFEEGKALGFYIRGAIKKLIHPTREDRGKVASETRNSKRKSAHANP